MQVRENSGLRLCADKNTENRIKAGMEKEEREWIWERWFGNWEQEC